MHDGVGPWAGGVAMILLALIGLWAASEAVDPPFLLFGMALSALGVSCVFGLIARLTGSRPAAPGGGE